MLVLFSGIANINSMVSSQRCLKSDSTSSSLALLIGIKLDYTDLHGKSGLSFALRSEKADSVRPYIDGDTLIICLWVAERMNF